MRDDLPAAAFGMKRPADASRGPMAVKLMLLVIFASQCLLVGCGGGLSVGAGVTSQPTAAAQTISISPASMSIPAGTSEQFIAKLSPSSLSQGVSWSISSTVCVTHSCGVIDPDGKYTAPSTPLVSPIKVIATSMADSSLVASALITVTVARAAGCDSSMTWGGNILAAKPLNASRFTPTGAMTQPRAGHTATLLPNGKVLVVDGGQLDIDDLLVSIPWAELFDPSQGTFAATGVPCVAREFQTATLLTSGKVLIAGGNEFSDYPTWLTPTSAAELYDPGAGTFANTGSMSIGRTYHTATSLPDGRVLVLGGSTNIGSGTSTITEALASSEIYDPLTSTFSAVGNMVAARAGHTATLLPSGKVLIVGGENDQGVLATSELYDPQTNSFALSGSMAVPRSRHTATLLANGKVLIAGGSSEKALFPGGIGGIPMQTAELYDPSTGTFQFTVSMQTGRIGHTATLLPDGTVLIAGGYKDWVGSPVIVGSLTFVGYESFDSAEIFNPLTASFNTIGPMNATRFWHTATPLKDGSVLITGGIGSDLPQASAEIYK